MSILLYKKWSKKVENLARGLIWVLLEYPKTPPPRAPPKVRYRAPKGRPRRWRQGAWVLFHKISNDMSILLFSILRISKMTYICFFCTLISLPPPGYQRVWGLGPPKGAHGGEGEREAGYYFKKYQMIFQFLGLQLWSPFALRVPSEPPPPKHARGEGELSTISQNQRYVWVFNIVRN